MTFAFGKKNGVRAQEVSITNEDRGRILELQLEAVDIVTGHLKLLPYDFYREFGLKVVKLWMHLTGLHVVPTQELVDWLRKELGENPSAIEIGAGSDRLGAFLGIPMTDSYLYESEPSARLHYELAGQIPPMPSKDVIKMEALEAVEHYKPEVVVGCFVTHLWRENDPARHGNQFGVYEEELLRRVQRYFMVGNLKTHEDKPILTLPHMAIKKKEIITRGQDETANRIFIWKGNPSIKDVPSKKIKHRGAQQQIKKLARELEKASRDVDDLVRSLGKAP